MLLSSFVTLTIYGMAYLPAVAGDEEVTAGACTVLDHGDRLRRCYCRQLSLSYQG